jgi:Ser/Thr protein kinase RdoA (MazF antagonist)
MGDPERAVEAFAIGDARVEPIRSGLIHQSFAVEAASGRYVLQRVNPIFAAAVHENIAAVTEHLDRKGVETPRLLATPGGALYAELGEAGRWRILTRIAGVSFDRCTDADQARSAGALLARFHTALDDLDHDFRELGFRFHDYAHDLAELARALDEHAGHRLYDAVAPLGEAILEASARTPAPKGLPARVIHDDLKFSNVLFAGESGADRARAVALIDLDTVTRAPLWRELGDAWRSWCNRAGEDEPEARLDLELLRAAAAGYAGALGFPIGAEELEACAIGLETMSLLLAARFAADALDESYFAWDPQRFASRGEHNRVRAAGQLSFYRQAEDARPELVRVLRSAG